MIAWLPVVSAVVVRVAAPPLSAELPRLVAPSKNSTVPVGELPPLSVAVKVTDSPTVAGFSDEVSARSGLSGSGSEFVIEITPSGDGQVILTLPADRVADGAGNGNPLESLVDLTHVTAYPTVTLSSAATGITSRAPITVSAAFSEAVSGLTLGEITVTGGTATALSGADAAYDITLTPSGLGDVTVTCTV